MKGFLTFCFVLFSLPVFPQGFDLDRLPPQLFFRNISTPEGLSHITVNSILKDSRGFVWIGTEDGLNRFDGSAFRVYRNNPKDSNTLSHNLVFSLLEDNSTGNIWIGTTNGLCYYDRRLDEIRSLPNVTDEDSNVVARMVFDEKRKRIWLACQEGGLRFVDMDLRRIKNYENPQLAGLTIATLRLRGDQLYLGTDGDGLRILDLESKQVESLTSKGSGLRLSSDDVKTLRFENDNLWIGTDGGLDRLSLQDHTMRHFTKENGSLNSNRVRSLAFASPGVLWIGTDGGGVNVIDAEGRSIARYLHSDFDDRTIADNTVRTIHIDPGGDIWLGTYNGGVSYHARESNDFYLIRKEHGEPVGLDNNFINAVSQTSDGRVWIGTGNGLNFIDKGRILTYPLNQYFDGEPQVIIALHADRKGGLWMGTYKHGTLYLDHGGITRYEKTSDPASISDNTVWQITEDQQGRIWFGSETGINIFTPKDRRFINHRNRPEGEFGKMFLPDQSQQILLSNGRIFVGTYGYLAMYDSSRDKSVVFSSIADQNHTINNPPIAVLHENEDGHIYVGTYGNGLCIYDADKNSFQVIDENDGLPNNNVVSIERDQHHMLWLGTNRGIVRYDPKVSTFVTFDRGYGLQGDVFSPRASFSASDGSFFFGGVKGLNVFKPAAIRPDSVDLKILLTELQSFNMIVRPGNSYLAASISESAEITVPYEDSRLISFRFSCPDYFSADRIKYEYRLLGFQEQWQPAEKGNPITFTNLNPGGYTLDVRAFINPSAKGAQKRLALFIQSPWHQTWYARVTGLLLLCGALVGYYRWRIYSLRTRRKELERLVTEQNHQILEQNQRLSLQNEELQESHGAIKQKTFELERANQVLTTLNREVIEQKEEIQTQSEELTESYHAISEINQSLEEKILKRTAELTKAFKELDTFFYRSSHDFRRPLTTFMGLAQVARISVKDPTALDLFEKVNETALQLDKMVKKLQAVGDVSTPDLLAEQTSMQEIIDYITTQFKDETDRRQLHIQTDIQTQRRFVSYPLLIRIILENLVENAIQFSTEAGAWIQISTSESEGNIVVQVSDQGRGIDSIYSEKIFDMYFRATDTSRGNGLGLFIVKKALERLQGGITVETERNIGSAFRFWFAPVSFI